MRYSDVTDTVKRRLRYEGVCPICHQPITQLHDFQYIKYVDGRNKSYSFFHTACLKEARSCVNATGRV